MYYIKQERKTKTTTSLCFNNKMGTILSFDWIWMNINTG